MKMRCTLLVLSVFLLGAKKNDCDLFEILGRPNHWGKSLTTDPKKHDPESFVYVVHGIESLSSLHFALGGKHSFFERNILESPEFIYERPYLSCSLINQNKSVTAMASGLILQLPKDGNVLGASPVDMGEPESLLGSRVRLLTEEKMRQARAQFEKKGLRLSPAQVLAETATPEGKTKTLYSFEDHKDINYNEVFVLPVGPDGSEVKIKGIYIKVDSQGHPRIGPFTLMQYRRLSKKLRIPIIFLKGEVSKTGTEQLEEITAEPSNQTIQFFYDGVFTHKKPPQADFEKAIKNCKLKWKGDEATFFLEGEKRIGKKVGQGFHANVVEDSTEPTVYKFPNSWQSAPALIVEGLLNDYILSRDHWDLKKHVVPILEMGELGSYIKRPAIAISSLATHIKDLSVEQKAQLKILFEKAKAFTTKTGIALDLKAENLAWNGSEWQIFDLGPRRSYRPYGFTTDIPNFETYLKVWRHSDPPDLPNINYSEKLREPDFTLNKIDSIPKG